MGTDDKTRNQHLTYLAISNSMRITALTATAFKKNGVTKVGGLNEAGKTSFLNCIDTAIMGPEAKSEANIKIQKLIHGDATEGFIVAKTEDFTIVCTVRPGRGVEYKVIHNVQGELKKPREVLNRLIGPVLDPLSLANLPADKLEAEIRDMMDLDFSGLDAERKKIYSERTDLNRDIKRLESLVSETPADPSLPLVEYKLSELTAELKRRMDMNQAIDRSEYELGQLLQKAREAAAFAGEAEEALREAECAHQAAIGAHEAELAKCQPGVRQDIEQIEFAISKAEETNGEIRKQIKRNEHTTELASVTKAADELTGMIQGIDTEKEQRMKAAKFPVEGLGLNEHGVTWKGEPFTQASSSRRSKVSTMMVAASDPTIRTLLIKRYMDYDKPYQKWFEQWTIDNDYQAIAEIVGIEDDYDIIIEDGTIARGGEKTAVKPTRKRSTKKPETDKPEQSVEANTNVDELNDLFGKFGAK